MDGRLLNMIPTPDKAKWWNVEDEHGRRAVFLHDTSGLWWEVADAENLTKHQLATHRAVCEIELGGK